VRDEYATVSHLDQNFDQEFAKTAVSARLMGIVNVTPDSFSDGGLYLDAEAATAHGRELIAEGAELLDVGGESTRPGAEAVDAAEERRRVEPVVSELAGEGTPISIDTSKVEVAAAALDAGASIVNDVTALGADPDLGALVAERGAGLVLMHMQGTPRTMQQDPTYDDVVDDVKAFLAERLELALDQGVAEERIWLDPGFGFGKTVEHNLELLRRLRELTELGRPLVVGTSRKSFIGKIGGAEVGERLGGTVATCAIAYANGAEVMRVHDVREVAEGLKTAAVILGG
jgi:dihydropteroate synthase